MDIEKLKEILKMVEESELPELEVEIRGKGGTGIRVKKGGGASNIPISVPVQTQLQSAPTKLAAPEIPVKAEVEEETEIREYAETSGLTEITSPIVGTFYRAPATDADPYIKVGDHVEPGQVVCIVEAMKLLNEIQSEVSGTVEKILVEDSQPVEFGQVMFLIRPN